MQKRLLSSGAIFAGTLSALLTGGCKGKNEAPPSPPPHQVLTAKVISRDAPLYLEEIGTCAALATVNIQAQVTGQITAREFKDGATVKKGDVLFRIDPRPYQAALDQSQGTLAQSRAQLDLDKINLARIVDLSQKKVVAPQDLDSARTAVATDQARIESAEGAVAAAQVNLDYCTIRSPIDGIAGLRQVDVGNIVSVNGGTSNTVLLTIQQIDPIYTDFTVAETDLPEVRRYVDGGKIKVETDAPGDGVPPRLGDLYFLDTAIQPGAGTVKVRAVSPNQDGLLWPGEFVHTRLILDTIKGAKLVPSQAVQISQRGPFIFVVRPDSTVELRPIKPGQRQGALVVILEG
jgi:multidrug efflux system membrane fusion protein